MTNQAKLCGIVASLLVHGSASQSWHRDFPRGQTKPESDPTSLSLNLKRLSLLGTWSAMATRSMILSS